MTTPGAGGRSSLATLTLVAWVLAAMLGIAGRVLTVVGASESSLFRTERPLESLRPEQGVAYVAATGRPDLSSHQTVSAARILEDGRPLGPATNVHETIRTLGRGRYSFWYDYVYLSASDNTDPRTNGRTYALDYPVVGAAAGANLWRGAQVVLFIAGALTLVLLAGSIRQVVAHGVSRGLKRLARGVADAVWVLPRLLQSTGRLVQSAAALWVLTAVLGGVSLAAFLVRSGSVTSVWSEFAISTIRPEEGAAFAGMLQRSDLSSHEARSPARILEDGRPLGPGNSQHADIRTEGRGRFSFWYDYVLFSASDSTDPRTNGRRYTVSYPPIGSTVARALYVSTIVSFTGAFVASVVALRRRRTVLAVAGRRVTAQTHAVLGGLSAWAARQVPRRGPRWSLRGPAAIALLVVLWLIVGGLAVAAREVYMARTGQSTRLWETVPLQDFVPETGHAFVAGTRRIELSSHLEPSVGRVLENGQRLGPGNAQHVDIRDQGQGRFSFWHDYVIFATSDNSDPRTNGRTYAMAYPAVGAVEARLVFLLAFFSSLVALAITALVVRKRALGESPARWFQHVWAHRATVLAAVGASGLLIVPLLRVTQAPAGFMVPAWGLALLTMLIVARVVRRTTGSTLPGRAVVVLLVAMVGGEVILTTMAPHRWQGCHTTDPIPAWDAFCVAPDSASYYFGYRPGSTRNPLYPWFITALTAGTSFEPSLYRNQAQAGALITNEADPLFRVVRGQILLLLAASVALALGLMVFLRSLAIPVIVLALYDYGFFTAIELNIVLTEALVQTCMFLVLAAFFLFLWRPRPAWMIGAAVACGLVYLTRQAGAYVALFLAVMIGWGLVRDWRVWWRPAVAAVAALLALMSIPDLYTYNLTGSLTRGQESIQYQYRIAHAMQYATLDDVALMPDAATKSWLTNAIGLRDREHRMVNEKYTTDYDRMTYYINQNLYAVAMPTYDPQWIQKLPLAEGNYSRVSEFYMAIATPILARHWPEYAQFAFKFWRLGLTYYPVSRMQLGPFGAWSIYALLWLLVLVFRDRYALAAATLIAAHWGHVALASLFAVPIPRMVWASEILVLLAATILIWRVGVAILAPARGQRTVAPMPAQEVVA